MHQNTQSLQDLRISDDPLQFPEVHAVFAVVVGSTLAELPLVYHTQARGSADQVPCAITVVDSLPYEDMKSRLVQNGWTPAQVDEAVPRSNYFHLTSPFTSDFNFESPLNRQWTAMFFDPGLRRLAAHPDAPGCAGTPLLGRARAEGQEHELREFFERHLQQLTAVRTETLALRPGVMSFLFTTYRGGTGAGATNRVGAILRSAMTGGEIHLRVLMPCVYLGDTRAHANALAAVRETQYYHRFRGGVPMKDGRALPAPFQTASYTFVGNGRQTLNPNDALMQAAAIVHAYTHVPSHSTILARRVDLTDVVPHDLNELPMHVGIESALSIRSVLPGVQDYLVTEWVHGELEQLRARFEEWSVAGDLGSEEELNVRKLVKLALDELNLHREHLLARLDPTPSPVSTLRAFFERANGMIGTMPAQAIKGSMSGLPTQVQEMFLRFEGAWQDRACDSAKTLVREISEYVASKTAATPHLELEALARIRNHVLSVAKEAKNEGEKEKIRRGDAGAKLGPALSAVQEARGILGFINEDEVTRDAAHKACEHAIAAALARAQQQRNEYLVQVLEDGVSSVDVHGKPITIHSVAAALIHKRLERLAEIRKSQAEQITELQRLLADISQRIQKRSRIFQRALLYDAMTVEKLNAVAAEVRKQNSFAPPIVAFVEGKESLGKTLNGLLPLLPSYSDSARTLTEIVTADANKRKLVVQLLRNCQPFTPLDREVEDQQRLRNRRDQLLILQVPEGQDGALAEIFLEEGIVSDRNCIVDSGADEIRFYYLRDGLPYSAVQPFRKYQQKHDEYVSNPGAIPPYTIANWHELPEIAPPLTNLRDHTERLLWLAKAVLPNWLTPKLSGGFLLRFEVDTGHGFNTTREERFGAFEDMVLWLAKQVESRKALDGELMRHQDANPELYKRALVEAWRQAVGQERHFLQEELYRLKVDPSKFPAGGVDALGSAATA